MSVDTCGDCGKKAEPESATATMVVMRSPKGDWALCSPCFRVSLRLAAEERKEREAKLAEQEHRERKTHQRERVGSHG